jgi:hypothetical protein
MKRILSILGVLLVATLASQPGVAGAKQRNGNGNYNLLIGGMFKGTGSASIAGNKIRFEGNVTDIDGVNGELNCTVQLKKDNHFISDTGNVNGKKAAFAGRLDTPDEVNERAIRGVRVICTFRTEDGRYGKIMGWIPNDDRMPNDKERGKGKGRPKD